MVQKVAQNTYWGINAKLPTELRAPGLSCVQVFYYLPLVHICNNAAGEAKFIALENSVKVGLEGIELHVNNKSLDVKVCYRAFYLLHLKSSVVVWLLGYWEGFCR